MALCDGRSIETGPVTLDGCRIPASESPTAPGRRCGSSVGTASAITSSTETWLRPPQRGRHRFRRPSWEAARASTCSPSRSPAARWRRSTPTRGTVFWRSGSASCRRCWTGPPTALGSQPLSATELRVFTAQGDLTQTVHLPSGLRATDGAFAPTGKSFAVTATKRTAHGRRSEALILRLGTAMPKPRALLADPGTFSKVSWSPDGRWLLFAWPDADAWLLDSSPEAARSCREPSGTSSGRNPARCASSSGAGGFPRPAGWRCTVAGTG